MSSFCFIYILPIFGRVDKKYGLSRNGQKFKQNAMKIISYNIHHYSQKKIDTLLEFGADVYILPEIHSSAEVALPEEYTLFRFANPEESTKGLGIICKKRCGFSVPEWFCQEHKYILPLCCNDLLLIAMWPTITKSNQNMGYPQIALEAIKYYSQYFDKKRVILSGDFNCFVGQKDESPKRGTLLQIVEFLSRYNIYSLYHKQSNEKFGNESKTTYHWLFKEEQRFFLDYTFTNIEDVKYKLKEWNSKFSDHHAQIIDI